MSLDKAIKHGKEHRKGYAERGKSGRSDPTCRPNGGGYIYACYHCESNRLFNSLRRVDAVIELQDDAFYDLREFKYDVMVDIAMSAMYRANEQKE